MKLISNKGHIPDLMWLCRNVSIITNISLSFMDAPNCQSPKVKTNQQSLQMYM